LLWYSKGRRPSYSIKRKGKEDKTRERKDALYESLSQVMELEKHK